MASPVRTSKGSPSSLLDRSSPPLWVNPCKLPLHPIDPDKDFAGAPRASLDELFHSLIKNAKFNHNHAKQIKDEFLNKNSSDALSEPDFEDGVRTYRLDWLPVIPPSSEEVFSQITLEQTFINAFEYMQYYAVGLEQIIFDQVSNDEVMTSKFNEIEKHLLQLLCEIQLGMYLQNITPPPDVMRHVMAHQYRAIDNISQRNTRDYIILRDYIFATDYIAQLFTYHQMKLMEKGNSE